MSLQNSVHGLATDTHGVPLAPGDCGEKMVDITWWIPKIQSNPMGPPVEGITQDNNSVLDFLRDFLMDSMWSL
jgi:hypothetical protein